MKKVGICLYYLKDTGSLSMTANTFAVHTSTASKVIREVCSAITHKLGPQYVKLPQTKDEMVEKAAEFLSKYGMHQAFGCIDGTHVPILRPFEHSQDYFLLQTILFIKCSSCLRLQRYIHGCRLQVARECA